MPTRISAELPSGSVAASTTGFACRRTTRASPATGGSNLRRRRSPQRPERDRVAEALRRPDVVLPRRAREAGEDVARPRRQLDLERAADAAGVAAEPQPARREQRDADDLPERGRVAVPADLGAFRVALHERLDERLRIELREPGRGLAYAQEPARQRLRRRDGLPALVVVVDAEVPRRPPRDDAVHPDLVELEPLDLREHVVLGPLVEQVGPVHEALGALLDRALPCHDRLLRPVPVRKRYGTRRRRRRGRGSFAGGGSINSRTSWSTVQYSRSDRATSSGRCPAGAVPSSPGVPRRGHSRSSATRSRSGVSRNGINRMCLPPSSPG